MNHGQQVRLAKAANDQGFTLPADAPDGWISFTSPLCPVRIWLTAEAGRPVLALADPAATDAPPHPIPLPDGAAIAVSAPGFDALDRLLDRVHTPPLVAEPAPPPYRADPAPDQSDPLPPTTEAAQLVQRRIGQELFRDRLSARQGGRCAITGLAVPELLRASHIKPWADATDAERLDPDNGLLLAAHLDAAFDRGLMTVGEDGTLRWSARLDAAARAILGVDAGWRVALTAAQESYLRWHRERVFRAG